MPNRLPPYLLCQQVSEIPGAVHRVSAQRFPPIGEIPFLWRTKGLLGYSISRKPRQTEVWYPKSSHAIRNRDPYYSVQ